MDEKAISDFWDRTDAFIDLANQQKLISGEGEVSASFLYGAARFNAFTSAGTTKTKKELEDLKEGFIEHLTRQYQESLKENFDDYLNNYDNYLSEQPEGVNIILDEADDKLTEL